MYTREEEMEKEKKDGVCQRLMEDCHYTFLDIYSAIIIFIFHLINVETFCVVVIATGSPFFYYYSLESKDGQHFSAQLSWILVSFAVVSPMIMQIRQAFIRRETALTILAEFKAISNNIFLAHDIWNWGTNGRSFLPIDFSLTTKCIIKNIYHNLENLLKLPTVTRGRHRFTLFGRQEASKVNQHVDLLIHQMSVSIRQLHLQVEVMKIHGLPPNEASRANQYNWFLQARIETLINIKNYRTPQATRSFTRIFIWILPLFYGPYYVYVAGGNQMDENSTNFFFALTLSIMTSLVMIGIFNVEKALEDPFTEDGLDCVRIQKVFTRFHQTLDISNNTLPTCNQ